MLRDIRFNDGPINAGDQRELVAFSDSDMTVAIRCFTDDPPPPGYKPCKACGTLPVRNGVPVAVTADAAAFRQPGGRLEITLEDKAGDSRKFTLMVRTRSSGAASAMTA